MCSSQVHLSLLSDGHTDDEQCARALLVDSFPSDQALQ
jgi:hypothetical protein